MGLGSGAFTNLVNAIQPGGWGGQTTANLRAQGVTPVGEAPSRTLGYILHQLKLHSMQTLYPSINLVGLTLTPTPLRISNSLVLTNQRRRHKLVG